ncbi:MAG TPA: hypothetical protein VMN56_05775 [Casimicrobiaceae bacterium]|nr:hypothetical protein [Casimicrobiaceae bacterium]
MRLSCAVALAVAFAMPAFAADVATGTFASKALSMHIKGAMAFRGTSVFDKKEVIVVPITSAEIDPALLAEYYDRRRTFERRIKDSNTGVVFLEFKPDGTYRGLSYYFARGNGCGYCAGGVDSTVKLSGGRVVGTVKATEADRKFDVRIDLPIAPDDHGAPLPEGGGDPGRAYLAYHAALVKRDAKALTPLLAEESRDTMARATKAGQATAFMNEIAQDHPSRSLSIGKGYSNGKAAVLFVTGERMNTKISGEVLLHNEGGRWRVEDELADVVLQ